MRSAQSLPELAPRLEIAVHRGDLDALAATWESLVDPSAPRRRLPIMGVDFRLVEIVFRRPGNHLSSSRATRAKRSVCLPLCAERSPLGGRRLVFMGEGIVGSDYLGVVCRAGDEARLARAFADRLAHESYDELEPRRHRARRSALARARGRLARVARRRRAALPAARTSRSSTTSTATSPSSPTAPARSGSAACAGSRSGPASRSRR